MASKRNKWLSTLVVLYISVMTAHKAFRQRSPLLPSKIARDAEPGQYSSVLSVSYLKWMKSGCRPG